MQKAFCAKASGWNGNLYHLISISPVLGITDGANPQKKKQRKTHKKHGNDSKHGKNQTLAPMLGEKGVSKLDEANKLSQGESLDTGDKIQNIQDKHEQTRSKRHESLDTGDKIQNIQDKHEQTRSKRHACSRLQPADFIECLGLG